MDISTIGIDIAKHVFHVCCMNKSGKVIRKKKLDRKEVFDFMRNQPVSIVGMEACSGAHYWGRELTKIGHEVKLMPAQYVKPYVKTNKNDANDAQGCAEAVTRPTMRFVAVKTEAQQELGQIHRVRERLIKARIALTNEIRGFLLEFGVVISKGVSEFSVNVHEALEKNKLPKLTKEMIARMVEEFHRVEEEVDFYENKIKQIHKEHPVSQRLGTISGVGPITATAIVAATPDPAQFKSGRQFAAFLGLVPRQNSTGGKTRLGGISKRGDVYIRKLLVQGAHSVIMHASKKGDKRSQWVRNLYLRKGTCKTAVAVANKNARIIWALMAKGTTYDGNYQSKSQLAA